MADKNIGDLQQISKLNDESLLVVEQDGEARKMPGKIFREFAESHSKEYVESAVQASQGAKDLFGRYMCIGLAAMLIFHTFENAGMCIGLMPVTGIPLPFLSYGGTSLITNMLAIGIVLSVTRHSHGTRL